jgi:hypothetical protein
VFGTVPLTDGQALACLKGYMNAFTWYQQTAGNRPIVTLNGANSFAQFDGIGTHLDSTSLVAAVPARSIILIIDIGTTRTNTDEVWMDCVPGSDGYRNYLDVENWSVGNAHMKLYTYNGDGFANSIDVPQGGKQILLVSYSGTAGAGQSKSRVGPNTMESGVGGDHSMLNVRLGNRHGGAYSSIGKLYGGFFYGKQLSQAESAQLNTFVGGL